MILFAGLCALVWALGGLSGAPRRVRVAAIGALYVGVLVAQVALPDGAGVRALFGGSAASWAALGIVAAAVLAYREALGWARARAGARVAPAPAAGAFRPAELDRYARHIMLREIGGPGQRRLREARVLVVGAGGLGSPALLYLAAAGVGTLGVIDDDVVEASNLQRQVIHRDRDIGRPKVASAAEAIAALNPFVSVHTWARRLDEESAAALVAGHDLVLDGSDNFATRYLVNRVCAAAGVPLIAAAMTQWEGQIGLYDPARGGPCFECVFAQAPAPGLVPTCAEAGIVAPLPGVIGAMMALEAVKALTGAGEGLRGRLLIHDALYAETRVMRTAPRPGCPACGGRGGAGQAGA